jgi:hypothetical protein
VVNSASTTVFGVFDGGNAQLFGNLTQSSDQRLKTNIQSLDASSSLSLIDALNPVTFTWLARPWAQCRSWASSRSRWSKCFLSLSHTSATALTPGGTLGVNYIGLIAPIVRAVQEIAKRRFPGEPDRLAARQRQRHPQSLRRYRDGDKRRS